MSSKRSRYNCVECDEDTDVLDDSVSTMKLVRCSVCDTILNKVTTTLPEAVVRDTQIASISGNLLNGSWDGLLDIIGDDLRDAIQESIGQTSATKQISVKYLSTLGRLKVDLRKTVLYDISLTIGPLTMLAVSASFGWLPESDTTFEAKSSIVIGSPICGESSILCREQCCGNLLLLKRGIVSFVEKTDRAVDSGAAALIVSQTYDMWPFAMTTGEEATPSDNGDTNSQLPPTVPLVSHIPVVMISQKDAELVTRMLDKLRTSSRNTSVMATLRIASDPVNECSICQEGFHAGEEVLKLPCRHLYHAECVTSWLQQHNTCPLCRLQLPNKQQEQQKASGGGSDTSLYYN